MLEELFFHFLFFILTLSLCLTFYRFIRGPHMVDRIMCLDLLALITAGLVAIHAIHSNQDIFLDIVLVLSIIAFMGTIVFARLIEGYMGKEGLNDS